MNLEPKEEEHEWNNNQAQRARDEMFAKFRQGQGTFAAVHIKKIPEIDHNGAADGGKSEGSDVFGGYHTTKRYAAQQKPFPPLATERLVPEVVELHIAENAKRHEKDKTSIQQNQATFTDMRVIE